MIYMDTERNKKTGLIFNSLDGISRATAPDFFYTRLKARMEKDTDQNKKPTWIVRPVYVLATLLLILAVNVIVFLKNGDEVVVADDNETAQQSIAAEYSLIDSNPMYDLNQDK